MENKMTTGKPFSLILRFTIPGFFGYLFQQFYNMVDTVIVGRFVSPSALAAVGSTGTISFLILGLSIGLTAGFTVLTSQRYGAGDEVGTRRSFTNGILLSLISIAILTFFSMAFLHPVLHLMNTPADIYDDAYIYIATIAAGSGLMVFYNFFASALRAIGDSKHPLYFLILSAILNIGLDLLFIVVFRMGTFGAALATDVSQGISALLCFLYILKKVEPLKPKKGDWKLWSDYSRLQINIGLPMALQFGITASGTMVMQTAVNQFGSIAVGSFTAASKVISLMTAAMPAFGQTMSAYVGQNYGFGDMDRVHQGTKDAMLMAVIYSVITGILTVVLLPVIIPLFFESGTDLSVYLPYARIYCLESAVCYIPLAMIYIYRNSMQGLGYGKTTLALGFMELFARLAAALISMQIASFALAAGADGIAWSTTGILSLILYLLVRKREVQRFRKKREENREGLEG